MIFHLTIYIGTNASSDLTTHECHREGMKSQTKKTKQQRNSSGGIVIEELAKGESYEKIATPGKEVDYP